MNLKKILLIAVVLVTVAGGVVAMNSCASIGKRATGARLEAMKAPPNWRDGKFVNPLSSVEPKLFESLRKWMHRVDNTVPKLIGRRPCFISDDYKVTLTQTLL